MSINNILIIKPSSLGDIIHTLPLLYAVRKGYPDAHISWVVKPGWAHILELSPYIDTVIPVDFSITKLSKIPALLSVPYHRRKKNNGRRYDLAIDVQCLLRSALLTLFAKKSIGLAAGREGSRFFYDIRVETDQLHAVERYMDLARAINCYTDKRNFRLNLTEKIKSRVEQLLKPVASSAIFNGKKVVAVNPNARWETKRWPLDRFQKLIDLLIVNKFSIIILGSRAEKEYLSGLEIKKYKNCLNLAGELNLQELVCLLKKVHCLVTNDTGPMHIAAAVETPVVALFGATDPAKTGPYGNIHRVLTPDATASMDCAPCLARKCNKNLACLKNISVQQVYENIEGAIL